MLRRTKIVATMGPATDSLEVLTDMMRAGEATVAEATDLRKGDFVGLSSCVLPGW